MLISLFIIVGAELLDISLNKTYVFISSSQFSTLWSVLAFVSLAIVYAIAQHYILKYAKRTAVHDLKDRDKSYLPVYIVVRVVQFMLIGILATVTLQIIITSVYNVHFLLFSIWISYGLAISLLGFLVWRFFVWFKTNKTMVVLFYGLAMASIAITAGLSLTLSTLLIVGQPPDVGQLVGLTEASMSDSLTGLNNLFFIFSVMAFLLTWLSTVLVLHHYSKTVGRIKYWIIVALPLVYFLTQFQPLFQSTLSTYSLEQPFLFSTIYTIVFGASKPIGGILFAAAFWSIARRMEKRELRNYMAISAFGLALIFSSEQAIILVNRIYPPFGLATISFLGLSSYLVLIGIFSSAVSISEDSSLRRVIRNFALREASLLDSIGTAQMEQEIQKRVLALTKIDQESMVEETGIQTSLSEEEMKAYLLEVLKEVKDTRTSYGEGTNESERGS